MYELIDVNDNVKMMSMIFCGISYDSNEYLLYSIRRNFREANLFVSKLIRNSSGYTISHDFLNGEKDVLERVVQRIISRESISSLEKDGFRIIRDVELGNINYFDVQKCYVSTVLISLVKDFLEYYEINRDDVFKSPIVDVIDDKKKFNQGFVGNIVVIMFGVFIFLFCISIVLGIIFK